MNERIAIKEFLVNQLGLSEGLEDDEKIFSSGRLDSLDVVSIFTFLEKKYSFKINPFDFGLEDFDSIELIVKTIEKSRR